MPSTFLGLNTAYTGLVASNAALNTTANNIANIETEGFSRQVVNQGAADAIRTYTSYGCVGTGVDIYGAERVRDVFYDVKYWNNNSKLGEYDKKQYYAGIIENYLDNTQTTKGFTAIFDEMDAALQSLSNNTGNTNYALDFIGKAGNLCEYFNLLYNNFQSMQNDVNDEIKIKVDEINSISSEIATLNKEINIIERDGTSMANELRDKRDLLVDQLSAIVDVSVEEQPVMDDRTGMQTGMNNYIVKIAGGQTLVNGYSYRELECVPRESHQQVNQNDHEGLYDIYWKDTGDEFGVYANSTQGELKGLFEMRDGNNDEAFHGRVAQVDPSAQTVKIQVTDDYLMDISKSTLPLTNGQITVGGDTYYYDKWTFEKTDTGECYYTFELIQDETKNPERIGTDKASQLAKVGEQVDYQGIPYYLEQMNEWVRDYVSAFNSIYGVDGATDYYAEDRSGANFFTGDNKLTGEQYTLDVKLGTNRYDSTQDGYFCLTAGNFNIVKSIENDPSTLATHTVETGGVSKYDIVENLIGLAVDKEKMQFRGCKAEDFLVCLMGDAALNANSANTFQGIYMDIEQIISNNRFSISGVDADEEAANMIKFQNAYNLSSKMISVLCEVYDKLIQETGV